VKQHVFLMLATLVAALPLIAATSSIAVVAPVAHGPDTEEKLDAALRALPAPRRAKLRIVRPTTEIVPETATAAVMHPGALATVHARHLIPHERTVHDPRIALRHAKKIVAICTVLAPETRRAAGVADAECDEAHVLLLH